MPKIKPALSPQAALLVARLRAIDTSAKPRFDEVVAVLLDSISALETGT